MSLLKRTKTPPVDQNEQCPFCKRWFKEGLGIAWHIKAVHKGGAVEQPKDREVEKW